MSRLYQFLCYMYIKIYKMFDFSFEISKSHVKTHQYNEWETRELFINAFWAIAQHSVIPLYFHDSLSRVASLEQ